MAATETWQIILGHIFGTKHGKNINVTSLWMLSGTRNPLRSLFNPQYAKKWRWAPYVMNTVVKRLLHIAQSLDQEHVFLTVDEDLYPIGDGTEVVCWPLQGYPNTLSWTTAFSNELSWIPWPPYGRFRSVWVVGRMWYIGCQCSSECDIQQRLCSCSANAETHIAGFVAITTPTIECTPGLCWCWA